ncbi:hypothetical protein OB919_06165 [Halobacteria archaeon AArc-curdl1]|uniref:Uncharacterized protein n=1 Tax=Natronosalvus hydrolyticus TaxID=2979988 RepID=A0AAP2Z6Y0_9EURY|nr:hypothetical protein [Halobacteria archaeon AArc-curdl1]
MPRPSSLRDSTQIVLPKEALSGLETQLDDEFTLTVFPEDDAHYRLIGSPVEIKAVSQFLARQGVSVR